MRCAVLGSPIAHSLSPTLHRAAYAALGLPWRYDAIEVDRAALAGFLAGLDASWRGLSLTMPLKRVVVPMLDSVSATVAEIGVANTALRDPDGHLSGHNTDVSGFSAALVERGLAQPQSALVLGGGATAASAILALARLGCTWVAVAVRDPSRAVEPRAIPGTSVDVVRLDDLPGGLAHVDLVVSTIPAEAQPPVGRLPASDALFDAIYRPWPTPLATAFAVSGRPVVGGLDLLVHQAVGQVELMTGVQRAPLQEMREAGERALAERV
jgi:shikimate dehydrogenase